MNMFMRMIPDTPMPVCMFMAGGIIRFKIIVMQMSMLGL